MRVQKKNGISKKSRKPHKENHQLRHHTELIYWNLYLFRIDYSHSLCTIINRVLFGFALAINDEERSNQTVTETPNEKKKRNERNNRNLQTRTLQGIPMRSKEAEWNVMCVRLRARLNQREDTTNLLCCVENPYNASLWPYFIRTFVMLFSLCLFRVCVWYAYFSLFFRSSCTIVADTLIHSHIYLTHARKWNAPAPRNTKFALSKKHLLMYF